MMEIERRVERQADKWMNVLSLFIKPDWLVDIAGSTATNQVLVNRERSSSIYLSLILFVFLSSSLSLIIHSTMYVDERKGFCISILSRMSIDVSIDQLFHCLNKYDVKLIGLKLLAKM